MLSLTHLGIMTSMSVDESDATFRATLELNTLVDETCAVPVATELGSHRRQNNLNLVTSLWTGHRSLLIRLAVFVFFVILVTLLETLVPGKLGILTQLLHSLVNQNVTIVSK